jgi:hypothetical protein
MIEMKRNRCIRVDILEIPSERLALEVLAQLDTRRQVTGLDPVQFGHDLVEVGRVLVRPHVDHAAVVLVDDLVRAAWEFVRRVLAEHVADV